MIGWAADKLLGGIFSSIDNYFDNETEKTKIKADVVKNYANKAVEDRIDARKYHFFWWIWMLFAAPPGLWLAFVYIDSIFYLPWDIANIPPSIKEYADVVIYSIFGSGSAMGAAQAISSAIRSR